MVCLRTVPNHRLVCKSGLASAFTMVICQSCLARMNDLDRSTAHGGRVKRHDTRRMLENQWCFYKMNLRCVCKALPFEWRSEHEKRVRLGRAE
jgi:hypothetical protein